MNPRNSMIRLPLFALAASSLLWLNACNSAETPSSAQSTPQQNAAPAQQAMGKTMDTAAVSAEFHKVLDDYFMASLKLSPITATAIGIPGYDAELPNFLGEDFRKQNEAFTREWLSKVQAIDRNALPESDQVSYDIFVYEKEQEIAGERFPGHLIPLNQMFNFTAFFAQMGSGQSLQPFKTVQNYRDWTGRMEKAVVIFDQSISNMREGISKGVVQPRVLMEKVLPQLDALIVERAEDSLFWKPIENFPEDFSADDRASLEASYRSMINDKLLPAYERLRDFVSDEYLPATRSTIGWSELPNGKAWYDYQIASQTTTDLTADEVHQFGLSEVARIRQEMENVKAQVGFEGDLQAFFAYLRNDDRFYYQTEAELIQAYQDLQAKIDAELPRLFDIFPKANYEVRPVEAFRAESSAGASYQAGSPDGSRKGVFYINTFNLKAQASYGTETLSLHEASPGHHFQISIQQEIEDLPSFRRFGGFTAFAEGWALYSESLGKELGLFSDPYQYFGRLSDEQLRAMRLVVDSGMHAKGWSREQAIQYMLDNSPMAESDAVAEVERYIAIPGQALAYKVGERAIRSLRTEAEQKLGSHFDIRAFHRVVLTGGAVPLAVLEQRVREWIKEQDHKAHS